ncbi:DUF4398 domain-containing protein [Nevskia sp.]|uniref:DUF4398 domain-containing protein n=1 Tax=Nevskia sp. TaxID=1929292 RepID=UPI0025E39F69|nr:DUF4398 domain-containing protein [Nevskia sp.]
MKPARQHLSLIMLGSLLGLSACGGLRLSSNGLPTFSPAAEAPTPGVEPSTAAVARIRASLLTLRSDPALAARVPDELAAAEAALQKADSSQHDKVNGPGLLYVAERKAAYATTVAEQRALEAEYEVLRKQRDALKGGR